MGSPGGSTGGQKHPQQRGRQPGPHGRKPGGWARGCGCALLIVLVLAVIGAVGFGVAALSSKNFSGDNRVDVPDNVPPAAAKPAPLVNIHAPGRTALQLTDWARPLSEQTGIPVQALVAYANAESIATQSRPQCHVTWNTLAGLGFVETRHGTYNGVRYGAAELNQNGVATPGITGPPLDGNGFAKIEDTDNGDLDGDKQWDRAVGPLQFIPDSWRRYGVDANGDGKADPQQIDDAAASAVRLLCDFDRDLSTPEGWTKAISAYNLSGEYVRKVRDAAANYALNQRPAV
ncbi:hypothetical protein CWC39_09425 [Corynebacterium heidelbergense]|uniref:Transglycosylase SLT domain-containing protein n=1 Tax=Corynebacterium heidelbergense TaxID=2055947 RepID=A0A364V9C5_9CORY|nr:hypothetical protein CWC39_09425 [Corynebacterium heidelbergense]